MEEDRDYRTSRMKKVLHRDYNMFFVTHKPNAKMMTQFIKGMDALATHAGKEFGGVAGPMAVKAIRTRNEPLDDEPTTPEGEAAIPGSVSMIK